MFAKDALNLHVFEKNLSHLKGRFNWFACCMQKQLQYCYFFLASRLQAQTCSAFFTGFFFFYVSFSCCIMFPYTVQHCDRNRLVVHCCGMLANAALQEFSLTNVLTDVQEVVYSGQPDSFWTFYLWGTKQRSLGCSGYIRIQLYTLCLKESPLFITCCSLLLCTCGTHLWLIEQNTKLLPFK